MATSAMRGGPQATWTRETIIEALRRYAALYGDDFTTATFSPSQAKWRDQPELIERYYAGDPETGQPWPSLGAIKARFDGSFNAAREAAGLSPNKPGPAAGRRQAGAHAPRRGESHVGATRVIYRDRKEDPEEVARLTRRAERAEARVGRLEEQLAARPRTRVQTRTKTKTKTVRVVDERAVERVRAQAETARAALLRRLERAQLAASAATALEADARRTAGRMASKLERAEAAAEAAEAEARRVRLDADREVGELRAAVARAEGVRRERVVIREEAPEAAVVRDAEARAADAERRAAVAEREYRELAAAATGEPRKLSRAEVDELRVKGPAGPALLGAALKELGRARSGNGDLRAALTAIASAAVSWRERL